MSLITYPLITQPRLDRHRLALNLTQGHSVEIRYFLITIEPAVIHNLLQTGPTSLAEQSGS